MACHLFADSFSDIFGDGMSMGILELFSLLHAVRDGFAVPAPFISPDWHGNNLDSRPLIRGKLAHGVRKLIKRIRSHRFIGLKWKRGVLLQLEHRERRVTAGSKDSIIRNLLCDCVWKEVLNLLLHRFTEKFWHRHKEQNLLALCRFGNFKNNVWRFVEKRSPRAHFLLKTRYRGE